MYSSMAEVCVADSERTISHGEDRCLSRADSIEPARKKSWLRESSVIAELLAGDGKLIGASE